MDVDEPFLDDPIIPAGYDDDDDDDDDDGDDADDDEADLICRVCRGEGTPENPLFHPCRCSGTIKFIHQDCLTQWIEHSQTDQCELCKYPFSFSPIYHASMPPALPRHVFILGLMKQVGGFVLLALRYSLVLTNWSLIMPLLVTRIWRLLFVQSDMSFFTSLFRFKQMTFSAVWLDSLQGLAIAVVNILVVLGVAALRDYIVFQGAGAGLDGGGAQAAQGAAAGPRAGDDPVAAAIVHEEEAEEDDDDDEDDEEIDVGQENNQNDHVRGDDDDQEQQQQQQQGDNIRGRARPQRDANDDDALAFGGLLDGPREDVTITELLGFKGPILNLVETSCWFLLFNATMLGCLGFVPLEIGQSIRVLVDYSSTQADLLWSSFSSSTSMPTEMPPAPTPVENATLAKIEPSLLNDVLSAALGYCFIVMFIVTLLAIESRFVRNAPPLVRLIRKLLTFALVLLKVGALMTFELGIFPLMCGALLNFSLLDVFAVTWQGRLDFLVEYPLSSIYLHWLLGTLYMFNFAGFVGLVRDMLRPGVLWFLRNPNDSTFNPINEMIEISLVNHVKRMLISAMLYVAHIFIMVYSVSQTALFLFPSVLPFRLNFDETLTDLPLDMLLIHFVLPFIISRIKPQVLFKSLVDVWIHVTAKALKLSSFLFGGMHPDEMDERGHVRSVPNSDAYRAPGMFQIPQLPGTVLTTDVYTPPLFRLRIAALLACLCVTAAAFIMGVLLGPIYLGRIVLARVIGRVDAHELYTFSTGAIIILAIAGIVNSLYHFNLTSVISAAALRRHARALRNGLILGFTTLVAMPLLAGLAVELLVVRPLMTPVAVSPVFMPVDVWTLGLAGVLLAYSVIANGPPSDLQAAVLEIRNNHLDHVNLRTVSRNFIVPVLCALAGLVAGPVLVAQLLLKTLAQLDVLLHLPIGELQWFEDLAARYANIVALSLIVLAVLVYECFLWATSIERTIRDDLYLIGRRLHNFDRPPADVAAAALEVR